MNQSDLLVLMHTRLPIQKPSKFIFEQKMKRVNRSKKTVKEILTLNNSAEKNIKKNNMRILRLLLYLDSFPLNVLSFFFQIYVLLLP